MALKYRITPCLWFDTQAQEAAEFYTSVFANSCIVRILRYSEEGQEVHGKPPGSVLTVDFELDGQPFIALNGGPQFPFTEAISLSVECVDQQEMDHYWDELSKGGEQGVCGWLKDRFGVSWQVVPTVLTQMLSDPDKAKTDRVTRAFMQMTKFDIAALERAYAGD